MKIGVERSSNTIEVQFTAKPNSIGSFTGLDDVLKELKPLDCRDQKQLQSMREITQTILTDCSPVSPDGNLIGAKGTENFNPLNIISVSPPKKKSAEPIHLTEACAIYKFENQENAEKIIFETIKQIQKAPNEQIQSTSKIIGEEVLLGETQEEPAETSYDIEQIKKIISLIISFYKQYPDFDWSSDEKKNACKALFQEKGSFIFKWKNREVKKQEDLSIQDAPSPTHGLFVYYLLCRKCGRLPTYEIKQGKAAWKIVEIVREIVKMKGSLLQRAWAPLKNLPELVSIAIEQSGLNLKFVSKELQNDPKTVLEAIGNDGLAIEFASEELKKNKDIISKAVNKNPLALQFVSKELQTREMVLAVVEKDGLALKYAHDFQNDREIVMEAVRNCGHSLGFASETLKEDPKVVDEAIKQNRYALGKSSPKLQANVKYMEEKVREFPPSIQFASFALKDNEDFVKIATTQDRSLVQHASARIQRKALLKKCCEIL